MSQKLRTQLCSVVKSWKDNKVPYQHRGTTRNGCDCSGLIIGALRELGYMENYKIRNYPPDWNLHVTVDNYVVEETEKIADEIERPDVGDLVLFHIGKCVAHIGVVIENGLFIHCHRKSKKCIVSSLWNSEWTTRISHFYRLSEGKLNG